jgi:hypothetical protein
MTDERKDKVRANMQWSYIEETVAWPIDIGLGKKVTVRVPTAENDKAIHAHNEVRTFTQQVAVQKRGLEISLINDLENTENTAKKAKNK